VGWATGQESEMTNRASGATRRAHDQIADGTLGPRTASSGTGADSPNDERVARFGGAARES